MARPYRLQGENCFYHIMSRGDDRKKIYTKPGDYGKFMDYVVKAKERYQFYLYAYCLMANHFHLLLETILPNISQIMHYVKGSYTTYYNIRHHRCGHLFQGRFKSIVVDKDSYFLEVSRYIHLNPVQAGVVQDPAAYGWSSYRGYLGKKDEYIDRDQVQQYLGMSHREYQQFVLDGLKKPNDPIDHVYAGFLLGSAGFIKDKLKDLEIQMTSEEVVQKRALIAHHEKAEQIIRAVITHFHTTLRKLRMSKARPMREKQVLIYLLREYTGLTNQAIGDIVGMRYPAVSKAGLTIKRLLEEDKQLKRTINKIVSSFQV
jgi:REP element-mobilizing transposase RayT